MLLEDEVLCFEGEGKNRKLLFKSKGHIVNYGLIAIVNLFAINTLVSSTHVPSYNWTAQGTGRIRLGRDTTTKTGGGTTGLTNPIDTNPNSQSGTTSNPAANQYRVAWSATWNAGTISGTVGEMGLFLNLINTLQAFGTTNASASSFILFSRLSTADGDFSAFEINTAAPLTIEWRLTLTFS